MLSRIFIDRPVLAWVVMVGVVLAGLAGVLHLPVAKYPDVAPPTVSVVTRYPGANAATVESSVTQILEQQLTGIDGLLYFSSYSSSTGGASITATFAKGVDPDKAQAQVQNRIQQATPRLPSQVQQQGVVATKENNSLLMLVDMYDSTDRVSMSDISDWMVGHLQDDLARVKGVGSLNLFVPSGYAMRIWLDPYRLRALGLMPADISAAIRAQNTDASAGQLGQLPTVSGQALTAVVNARSRLQTAGQFRAIVVKSRADGAVIHLGDVARVELGETQYGSRGQYNRHPASGFAVYLAPGADALRTAAAVKARVVELTGDKPAGWRINYPRDVSDFVILSITEVLVTLAIAVVLVIVVMLVFLQSVRATLIPALAVPIVLMGTCGILALFGYSLNTLTLFAMVLAIGLLVDDAIIVVENVERLMADEGLSPRDATLKGMAELRSALVGVALVLSAVLLPMAFIGGSTGEIYRQFSVTIITAMVLSVLVALTITPALCAALLRPAARPHGSGGWSGRFNRGFDGLAAWQVRGVRRMLRHRGVAFGAYALLVAALALLALRLPTGFLPNEDQGSALVGFDLPAGATIARTDAAARRVQDYYLNEEKRDVSGLFTMEGFGFNGPGQNAGLGFVILAPFDERRSAKESASAINARAQASFAGLRDAQVYALTPPPIDGFGLSNGFNLQLLNTSGMPRADFTAAEKRLIAAAAKDPLLASAYASSVPDQPQLRVKIDDAKLAVLNLDPADVTETLNAAWGGEYVNDFIDRGRVKQVLMQGEAPYRMLPTDLGAWAVRARTPAVDGSATMVPFSAFAATSWEQGPTTLSRFNGLPSLEIDGAPAKGVSSGQAMERMAALQKRYAAGTSLAWSGLSYEERAAGSQAPLLYGAAILVVFLCLAAVYESWTAPLAVLLVIPLGVVGAVLAVTLRGLVNDIYFRVGLLTTMGLAAKNGILIVEFAQAAMKGGASAADAALVAARLRLRPILMTSLAFVAGVLPLAFAGGAGAPSRIAIGTSVAGGMLTGTVLAIYYVPLFFVTVVRIFRRTERVSREAPVAREAA